MSGPDEREFFDNLGAAETTPPSHQPDPPPPPSGEFQQTGRQTCGGRRRAVVGSVSAAGPPSGPIQTAGPSSGPNPTAGPPPAGGPSGPAGRGADPTAVMPPGPGASPSPSPVVATEPIPRHPSHPQARGVPAMHWSNNAPRYRPAGEGYPPPRPGDPTSQQPPEYPHRARRSRPRFYSAPRPQPRSPVFRPRWRRVAARAAARQRSDRQQEDSTVAGLAKTVIHVELSRHQPRRVARRTRSASAQ